MNNNTTTSSVLITGATGFIGHRILAELLGRGVRCAVLLRPAACERLGRLKPLLRSLGVDAERHLADGSLIPVEGDIQGSLPSRLAVPVDGVIHAAACTRFTLDSQGDPLATNVEGTAHLLRWMGEQGIRVLHLVSTAYVCGRRPAATERIESQEPGFHNVYERSKWQAERLAERWAVEGGRSLTIHRPSIVVGEHATGAATKFDGFYVSIRAVELLAKAMKQRGPAAVRIRGLSQGRQNIVPVDYVAAMIAGAVVTPSAHGRIYHLTNPCPPTSQEILDAAQRHFGVEGCRFVPPDQFPRSGLTSLERLVRQASASIEHYMADTPDFDRSNTCELEAILGLACPAYPADAMGRLIRYATSAWARQETPQRGDAAHFADYFERFLPRHVPLSQVARMTGLSLAMRFIIDDVPGAQWACRFDRGQLADVKHGPNSIHEDFGYRTTRQAFWKAVSGRVHPQELFLTGQASIFGNVEKAMKMAMILNAFAREFPFVPEEAA